MFFRIRPNPHDNDRLTRTVMFEATPGQTYAIDAERLHKTPDLLNKLSKSAGWRVRAVDALAYVILVGSILLSFKMAWWLFLPGAALCALMLQMGRQSAGSIAKSAALQSNGAVFYLHSIGALWLVHSASAV